MGGRHYWGRSWVVVAALRAGEKGLIRIMLLRLDVALGIAGRHARKINIWNNKDDFACSIVYIYKRARTRRERTKGVVVRKRGLHNAAAKVSTFASLWINFEIMKFFGL